MHSSTVLTLPVGSSFRPSGQNLPGPIPLGPSSLSPGSLCCGPVQHLLGPLGPHPPSPYLRLELCSTELSVISRSRGGRLPLPTTSHLSPVLALIARIHQMLTDVYHILPVRFGGASQRGHSWSRGKASLLYGCRPLFLRQELPLLWSQFQQTPFRISCS